MQWLERNCKQKESLSCLAIVLVENVWIYNKWSVQNVWICNDLMVLMFNLFVSNLQVIHNWIVVPVDISVSLLLSSFWAEVDLNKQIVLTVFSCLLLYVSFICYSTHAELFSGGKPPIADRESWVTGISHLAARGPGPTQGPLVEVKGPPVDQGFF